MHTHLFVRALGVLMLGIAAVPVAAVAATPPSLTVTFVGTGSATDFSESGYVVGNTIPTSTTQKTSWIWKDGVRTALPLPTGMTMSSVKSVNDAGVAVGLVASSVTAKPVAAKWTPGDSGYRVEVLVSPDGSPLFVASAINDSGVIVGITEADGAPFIYNGVTYTSKINPTFRMSPDGSFVVLPALGSFSTSLFTTFDTIRGPQLTDSGKVYNGIRTILHEDGAIETVPPTSTLLGSYEFNGYVNNAGDLGGHVGLTCSSCSTIVGLKFSQSTNMWSRYPLFSNSYGAFTALNERGDAAWYGGIYAPGTYLHLEGVGDYALPSLLDPASAGSWSLLGGALLNDVGQVLTTGRNTSTGQSGVVLLSPGAALQTPAVPVLSGVAHPATSQQNWDSITLSWTLPTVIPAPTGFVLERKGPTDTGFSVINTAAWYATQYEDQALVPLATYSYRIASVGQGGQSAYSNEVTITAPAAKDNEAPVIVSSSPASGLVVSFPFTVSMRATDNVGVTFSEIHVTPNMGETRVCSGTTGDLTCSWTGADPMPRLPDETTSFTLTYRAFDALGNVASKDVTLALAPIPAPVPVPVPLPIPTVDIVRPVVTFGAPANRATVSGVVPVTVNATDNIGVVRMTLVTSRGVTVCSSVSESLSCNWDTSTVSTGTQYLIARAYDARGNVGIAYRVVKVVR